MDPKCLQYFNLSPIRPLTHTKESSHGTAVPREKSVGSDIDRLDGRRRSLEEVRGAEARLGPRTGDELGSLVERLSDAQDVDRGKAEDPVGRPLQAGEVEQQRRLLLEGLAFELLDLAPSSGHGGLDLAGGLGAGETRLAVGREPAATVEDVPRLEVGPQLPVVLENEGLDGRLALGQQSQGRSLDLSDGQQRAVSVAAARQDR